MRWRHRANVWFTLLALSTVIVTACAPSAPAARPEAPNSATVVNQTARPRGGITIAVAWEPDQLGAKSTGGESGSEPRWMFNSPLTYWDEVGGLHPGLAREIPTRDNGDWVVRADGTMVTTYRLRPNLRWHDGVPITAPDFVFSHQVITDPALPFRTEVERKMTSVQALDDLSLQITWSEPYVFANALGMPDLGPLPRHRMEEKYRADKATFIQKEDWTSAFVGSGPFKLDRWDVGVRIVARAFDDWFLGPPKLETIELRFISDPNTILANLLSGEIDFATSPPLRISEAITVRDQWAASNAGYIKGWEQRIRYVEYQFREVPNWQRVVTDARVRKALTHAIDREQVASVMTSGLGRIADSWALPADPVFAEMERTTAKYPYDPQRALSLLEEVGWRRQASGALTNAAGQTLDVDLNSGSAESQLTAIIADAWKSVGFNTNIEVVPAAQLSDPRSRSAFLGGRIGQRGPTIDGFHFVSSKIPQPPRFNEANYGSFSDPEIDRLQNLALTSFDEPERRRAAVAMNQALSSMAAYSPLYYQSDVLLAKARLTGPIRPGLTQAGVTWNIFSWQVSS